jgi:hypothetical protein
MKTKIIILGKTFILPFEVDFKRFCILLIAVSIAAFCLMIKKCKLDIMDGEIQIEKNSTIRELKK